MGYFPYLAMNVVYWRISWGYSFRCYGKYWDMLEILLYFNPMFDLIHTQFGEKGMSTNGATLNSTIELAEPPLKLDFWGVRVHHFWTCGTHANCLFSRIEERVSKHI